MTQENLIEKLKTIVEPEKVGEVESLIDPCGFAQIINHYHFNPEITGIIAVNEPLKLSEVGALFTVEQAEKFDVSFVEDLIRRGLVTMVFPEKRANKDDVKALSFLEVGRKTKVFAFYAPPFYLISITNEVWQ